MFGLFLFWILLFKDVQPGLFFIRIFRVLNTVQSFIFKVHAVDFSLSAATRLSYHSCLRLSTTFFNFFELFQEFVSRFYAATVIYYNSLFSACQALFWTFFKAQLLFNCRNGYWFYQNRSLLSSTFFFFFWRSFFAPHLLR